jgi:hypothetical protein
MGDPTFPKLPDVKAWDIDCPVCGTFAGTKCPSGRSCPERVEETYSMRRQYAQWSRATDGEDRLREAHEVVWALVGKYVELRDAKAVQAGLRYVDLVTYFYANWVFNHTARSVWQLGVPAITK